MVRWILAALAIPVLSLAIWGAYGRFVIKAPEPLSASVRSAGAGGGPDASFEPVPLVRLLATPERHHGRKVRVQGYLTLEFEDAGLHLDAASYQGGMRGNAIWVDAPAWLRPEDRRRLTRNHAEVTGVFDASGRGHMGAFSGRLTDIRSIDRLMTQAEFERVRLGWNRNAIFQAFLSPWFLTVVGWTGLGIFWLARRAAR